MLGLIMVAAMVPGLLIGLRRTTAIDYDAVAYRTGAILIEDPGWPVFPPWELSNNKDGVDRLGLAVSKDTPNVLSPRKIEKFFSRSLFPDDIDHRKRIIFGDYPYRFNISLSDWSGYVYQPVGDSLPDLGGYGYIRRIVKIKESPSATVDLGEPYAAQYNVSAYNETKSNQTFTVRLNLSELVNRAINPAYQYDPRVEPIDFAIINFSLKLNNTDLFFNGTSLFPQDFPAAATPQNWTDQGLLPPQNATLKKVRFYKNEITSALPFPYDTLDPIYTLKIDGGCCYNLTPNTLVSSSISLYIEPELLPLDESTVLDITFTFSDTFNETVSTPLPRTLINGTHVLNYSTIDMPPLQNGWLEVAIW